MSYYTDTVRLLQYYNVDRNTNYLRHFFSQLSTIREIYAIALINAITSSYCTVESLVLNCITQEQWMRRIALKDIRNYVVFTMYKDFKKVIKTEPYISCDNDDAIMHSCDRESTIGMYVENLARLIETVYYIHHIHTIKYHQEKIIEGQWKMCHEYLNSVSLIESTQFLFSLLEKIIVS